MPKAIFDRYSTFWIVLICLPLLFLPKINLIALADNESAGIRIDDVILLLFACLFFWAHTSLGQRLSDIERWVLILVGFSLLSFSLNRLFIFFGLLHVKASIFYCLRILEYFLFFYIGIFSVLFFRAGSIVKTLFLWNLVLMLLQKIELIGQFSIYGYLPTASDRVTGAASFPSEAGVLINMMFCFLIYDEDRNKQLWVMLPPLLRAFFAKTYAYWLFLICVMLVIFTGSRIAILGLAIAFLFRIKDDLKNGSPGIWIFAAAFVIMTAALMTLAIMHTDSLSIRSAGLLSMQNVELVERVWEKIDLSLDPIGQKSVPNKNCDKSWWIRIHKWCYALKTYYLHPETYLQGIGPGFAMAALDGGFLRILTEYGLIGCLIFWKILSPIYHKSKQLKWMVVVFLINMIFFDVYLAYKPMSLLFFITGCAYNLAEIKTPATCTRA